MKMVAAAKLRRAQDAVLRARPYAQLIDEMLASLARARADADLPPHPLMAARPIRRVEAVLMTSDRGLCGGFHPHNHPPRQPSPGRGGTEFQAAHSPTNG